MISWDSVKDSFAWDGSLRDIYIAPASVADWAAIWPLLRGYPGAEFSLDGHKQAPPGEVQEVFALRALASPMLRLKAGSAWVVFLTSSPPRRLSAILTRVSSVRSRTWKRCSSLSARLATGRASLQSLRQRTARSSRLSHMIHRNRLFKERESEHNNCVQATPVSACCEFLSQGSGAPDAELSPR